MSLQCPFDLSQRYFFKIPRLQCSNQGSHEMEFLLLSLKSVCMIAIRALTGMQLISNEEKMLRWQNIVNVDLFLKKSDSKECKTNLECRKIKCEAIRSRKITAFTLPLSILKAQLSVASGKAVAVEWRERNPDWSQEIRLFSVEYS